MSEGIEEVATHWMIKNTFYNTLSNITGRLGGLLATVLIARILLPELFGIYSLVLTIVLFVVTAVDSGINGTQIKYVSEALNNNQIKKARAYFRFLFGLRLIISGALSLALFLLARPISIYIFNKPLLSTPLQVGAIYLFSSSLLNAFISFTYSTKKVNYIFFQELILQASKVFLVTVLLLLLKFHSVSLVIFTLLLASLIANLFLFQFMKRSYRNILFGKKVKIQKKKVLKFLLFLAVTGITASIFVHLDTIILGIIVPSTKLIAFYQVALTIVQSVTILLTFSSNVFLPFFTQLKGKELEKQFKKIFGYTIVLSVPATFGLIFIARPFISLIFGQQYLGAVLPLSILSFIIIETSAGTLFSTVLVAKGKPEYQMNVSIATSIIYVILGVVLIKTFAMVNPNYSIIGAAIATLVSRYIAFFSLGIVTYKKFKIKPDFSPFYKSLFSSLLMFFILIGMDKLFNLTFPLAVIEIIFGSLFYFSFMLLIRGISKEDFKIFKRMIKNKNIRS